MSGPKVISIMSLEEVVENCHIWLARVDAEIEGWRRIGRRNTVITSADDKAVRESRALLVRMLRAGDYFPMQNEASLLIQTLQADMDQRLEKAADSRAGKQRVARSLKFAATALLQQATGQGIDLPREVSAILNKASSGNCEDVKAIENAVSQVVSLTKTSSKAVSERSPMVKEMIASAKAESLDDWIQRTGLTEPADRRIEAAEKLIGQIGAMDEGFSDDGFRQRLEELIDLKQSPHRDLKLDAICLELKELLERTTRWTAVERRLAELLKEAEVTGDLSAMQPQFAEFTDVHQRRDIVAAGALVSRLRQTLDILAARRGAEKKRKALILGLTELGYTVNTDMTKIWANQKQLVVRKGENAATGIELAGDFEVGKCQVRVVAFEGEAIRDKEQERAEEEQWCSALATLQSRLAESGTELKIEKATPAGVSPLKIVKSFWTSDFASARPEDVPVTKQLRREM